MIEDILNNLDWLFSGIGVVVLGAIITLLRRAKLPVLSKPFLIIHEWISSVFSSDKKVSNRINLDLRPRHRPFEIQLGELPKSRFWIRCINFNSFRLKLKQVTIETYYHGTILHMNTFYHDRFIEKKSIDDVVLVEDNLTGEQADFIAKHGIESISDCTVYIKAVFQSPTKEVTYENPCLEGIKPILVNQNYRVNKNKTLNKIAV